MYISVGIILSTESFFLSKCYLTETIITFEYHQASCEIRENIVERCKGSYKYAFQ